MKAQNTFTVTAVLDGITLNGYLYVQQSPLVQFFTKGSDRYMPDFKVPGNQPIVSLILRDTSTGGIFQTTDSTVQDVVWKYNGLALTFDGSGNCTAPTGLAGKIKKIAQNSVTVDGQSVVVPAIRIVDNLVSISDFDDDRISAAGNVVINNQPIPFAEVGTTVQIKQAGGLSLALVIAGDSAINGSETSEVLKATLMRDGAVISEPSSLAEYAIRWSKVPSGEFKNPADGWNLTVDKSDIDGSLHIRCDVFEADNLKTPVVSAYHDIQDMTDPWYMLFNFTPVVGNPIGTQLRRGESLKAQAVAWKRCDPPVSRVLDSCSWYTYNNEGQEFALLGKGAPSFTAPEVILEYSDVVKAGGGIVVVCHANFTV